MLVPLRHRRAGWAAAIALAALLVAAPAPAAPPHKVPAAAAATARAQARIAARLFESGAYDEARAAIDQGLAANPRELSLLRLQGSLRMATGDLPGALAAYQAYLAAGATGAKKRQVEGLVKELRPVTSTSLQITVTNGPAQVFIPAVTKTVFCQATPACPPTPILPRAYQVTVERPGFERWTGRVTVGNGQHATATVTLVELPSRLVVHTAPATSQVTVDGRPFDPAVPLAPGHHVLVVAAGGHQPARRELEAHAGQPLALDVALAAIPSPAPPVAAVQAVDPPPHARFWNSRRVTAVVAGGVAVAAGATGVVLGLQARQLDRDTYALCASPETPCPAAGSANARNDQARTRAVEANVAYGVAGAATIAAAILWWTGREQAVAIAPAPGSGAVVGLAGRF